MASRSLPLLLALPLLAGGCAQIQLIREDIAAVDRKVDSTRADVRDVHARLSEQGMRSGNEADRMRADLNQLLSQLTLDQQKIRAQLDETQHQLSELNREVQLLRSQRSGRPAAAAPTDSTAAAAEANKPSSGLDVDKLYRMASEDFQRRKYDLAYQGFQSVLSKDTGNILAAKALYMMGETRFVQKNYDEARTLYKRVIRDYPKDPQACAARFKIGLSYDTQGQTKDRNSAWKDLQGACPGSNEALRAKDLMDNGGQ